MLWRLRRNREKPRRMPQEGRCASCRYLRDESPDAFALPRRDGSKQIDQSVNRYDERLTSRRWMALCFALGSSCFLVGPFPGYAQLVGDSADAVTFFVGSILFTVGGALQSWLAWSGRHSAAGGGAAWWAAIIQSAGTLFFNVTTYQAMHTALTSPEYNKLVWRPDWRGSICFLVSGAIAYHASHRRGWLPVRGGEGWWQPAVNLL